MLRTYKREAIRDWNISAGPPVYPDRYELSASRENHLAVVGGMHCRVRGARYTGEIRICLLENGAYAVSAGSECRENIPGNILGEVLDSMIMGKERARRGS